MKQLIIALFLLQSLLCKGQVRLLSFEDSNYKVVITDTKTIDSGYVLSMCMVDSNQPNYSALIKTDTKGNLVWTKKIPYFYYGGYIHLCRNGDYFINSTDQIKNFARVDSNGVVLWNLIFSFSINGAESNRNYDVLELPNGTFALCGTNRFRKNQGYNNYNGWLIFLDSATGAPLSMEKFYEYKNWQLSYDYQFNSLIFLNGYIYIGGSSTINFKTRCTIWKLDTLGNYIEAYYLDDAFLLNNKNYVAGTITQLEKINNKMYVAGNYINDKQATDSERHEVIFVGTFDTFSKKMSVKLFDYDSSIRYVNTSKVYFEDTSSFYFSADPDYYSSSHPLYKRGNSIYTINIHGHSLRAYKISTDSSLNIRTVASKEDTIIVSGEIGDHYKGFYSYFITNKIVANTCGFYDTTLSVDTFSGYLTPIDTPNILSATIIAPYFISDTSTNADSLSYKYLCGDDPLNNIYNISYKYDNIIVYPNPNNGVFAIHFPDEKPDENFDITLFDLLGRTLEFTVVDITEHEKSVHINSNIKGIIYCRIKTSDSSYSSIIRVQ
ncbi:MAG: T9SS type A sorting domain-containing protein [Chitinophagales bacterium]|nr:T9SS type A sorting domain-containing protein [Chitinophagaceae bacterium]MCB9063613.1 T9SS type A sorting domain-containing protein [Chitinophagales bacterium]